MFCCHQDNIFLLPAGHWGLIWGMRLTCIEHLLMNTAIPFTPGLAAWITLTRARAWRRSAMATPFLRVQDQTILMASESGWGSIVSGMLRPRARDREQSEIRLWVSLPGPHQLEAGLFRIDLSRKDKGGRKEYDNVEKWTIWLNSLGVFICFSITKKALLGARWQEEGPSCLWNVCKCSLFAWALSKSL